MTGEYQKFSNAYALLCDAENATILAIRCCEKSEFPSFCHLLQIKQPNF